MPETTNRRGRAPRYPDDATFELTGANPWKAEKKNGERLAAALELPAPRTVGACVAAGLTRGDIAYLVEHQHAVVRSTHHHRPPEEEAAE